MALPYFIESHVCYIQQEEYGITNPAFRAEIEESGTNTENILDGYNEGMDIQLVFRVLAGMCDGQNTDHQVILHATSKQVKLILVSLHAYRPGHVQYKISRISQWSTDPPAIQRQNFFHQIVSTYPITAKQTDFNFNSEVNDPGHQVEGISIECLLELAYN